VRIVWPTVEPAGGIVVLQTSAGWPSNVVGPRSAAPGRMANGEGGLGVGMIVPVPSFERMMKFTLLTTSLTLVTFSPS